MRPATWALILMLIASARMISTYRVLNHTTDEPAHLACGIEWLENGTYNYEAQHPPLARVVGAIGIYLAGARWGEEKDMYVEGFHLLGTGHRYNRNLFYSRLAMLPFFWIGGLVVFLWTRRLAGADTAVISTLLYSTTPVLLGHGSLVTTDMAVTALTGAALLASLWLGEKPGWVRSFVFGVALAGALLSKFSALGFLPVAWLLMGLWHRPAWKQILRCARYAPVTLITTAFLIWAAYNFSMQGMLPAPEFFLGLQSVIEHNKVGHLAFLMGKLRMQGFWYYYPVDLAIKTPLALLILVITGLITRARFAFPVLFCVAVLSVAMFSHINIGIRHILPIYIGLAICGGIAARRIPRSAAIALIAWQVVAGAAHHPEYMAYTNELAGSHPERFVVDSDLDWEQDLRRLGIRIRELGANKVILRQGNVGYFIAGGSFPPFELMKEGDPRKPGWTAVSVTALKLSRWPAWAETATPVERVGSSFLLFHTPE